MSLKVITGPSSEPVSLDEAKLHLRVDGTTEDALISSLIVAAREEVEHLTGRALMTQTLEAAFDCFTDKMRLPKPPLVSITSVKYIDDSGVEQTLDAANYYVDDHREPVRFVRAFGVCWPSTRRQESAVKILYQAGYASAGAVPAGIKAWMLLRIGSLYANRESEAVGVTVAALPYVDRLLDVYRVYA